MPLWFLADGRPTSVIINEKQQPSYERDETSFGNTAKYGYVVFDRSQYNKKWAQTGDDDTYTTSYEATTSKLGDKIAAPEDNLWKNGKLYELEDYTAALISGPGKSTSHIGEREIPGRCSRLNGIQPDRRNQHHAASCLCGLA